jgi:hypothetical protein
MNKRQVQAVLELAVVLGLFGLVAFGSGGARAFALVALLIAFVVYRRQR